MKGTVAAFGEYDGRGMAAFFRNGVLEDLLIDPPSGVIRPGAIYRAKAGRLLKGLGGAIMDTPDGPVFLRNAKGISEGQTLLVQATTFAEPGKATPVTTRLIFKSRYCLATPDRPGTNLSKAIRDETRRVELRELLDGLTDGAMGLVIRSAADEADDDAVRSDVVETVKLAKAVVAEGAGGATELLLDGPGASALAWRDWPAPDITDQGKAALNDNGVPDEIDAIQSTRISLSSLGTMYVEGTRALVAIDVNTGQGSGGAAALKANLAAAKELPRALRLRGLGGQIVVDFAPMSKKDRRQIEAALAKAFKADPIETSLVGWTTLGLFEIQRKRERTPFAEAIGRPPQ